MWFIMFNALHTTWQGQSQKMSSNGKNMKKTINELTLFVYVYNQQYMRKNATKPQSSKSESHIYSQANFGQKQRKQ